MWTPCSQAVVKPNVADIPKPVSVDISILYGGLIFPKANHVSIFSYYMRNRAWGPHNKILDRFFLVCLVSHAFIQRNVFTFTRYLFGWFSLLRNCRLRFGFFRLIITSSILCRVYLFKNHVRRCKGWPVRHNFHITVAIQNFIHDDIQV